MRHMKKPWKQTVPPPPTPKCACDHFKDEYECPCKEHLCDLLEKPRDVS